MRISDWGSDVCSSDQVTEQHHAECHRPQRADAGPHRVGRAEGQRAQGEAQQTEAYHYGKNGGDRRPEAGEALGILQADGPADLEKAGEKEDKPGHDPLLREMGSSPTGRAWIGRKATTRSSAPGDVFDIGQADGAFKGVAA